MKIGIGLIFYDDLESLKRCIPTIHADTIYAIDGRYKDFNSPNPLSADGSREFLQSFENVKLIDAPDLQQVEKRNIYLKECKEDFLFVVDSDHWMEGNWDSFRKELDEKVNDGNGCGYWFWINDLDRKSNIFQCLGFFHPNQIQYKYRHDWYEFENQRILPYSHNNKYTKLKTLTVFNDKSLRNKTRKSSGDSWSKKSRKKEFRKTKYLNIYNKIKNLFSKTKD